MTSVASPTPRLCTFEPTLDEALADPIVQLVIARDGLTTADVHRTLDVQRQRLLARPSASGLCSKM